MKRRLPLKRRAGWVRLVLLSVWTAQIALAQEAPMTTLECGYTNHFPAVQAPTRCFYVAPQGDDGNDGLSPQKAWKTLARVNAATWAPGEALLLQGGGTFTGTLTVQMEAPGSAERPVVISSFGEGRATIDGGASHGVVIRGATGVTLRDLFIRGAGRKTGNERGVGVLLENGAFLIVDRVEVSGFQHAGVEVRGCADVRVTRVYAHDNGFAGITSAGRTQSRNLYIGDCRAINNPGDPTVTQNHSGNGIALYSLANATVEYCEAAGNGWDMPWRGNGPVGIWCASRADRVLIQYCISHDNKTPAGAADGGGFDFDGGTTNSVMQYNYSYNNAGCGYLLCQYAGGPLWKDNVIRYNLSQNDGRQSHKAALVSYDGGGAGYQDGDVYNNVLYVTGDCDTVKLEHNTPGLVFHNNVLVVAGTGRLVSGAMNAVFQGNWYWNRGAAEFDVDGFESLAAWSAATGQEKLDGKLVGGYGDPRLSAVGAAAPLTEPRLLPQLLAYLAQADSPLTGAGLELARRFALADGEADFWGNRLPAGARSFGMHEPLGAPAQRPTSTTATFTPPSAHPHVTPVAATYVITRLGALAALRQVPAALAALPEWVTSHRGRTLAHLRLALAGEDLALQVQVNDAEVKRGAHPWEGSEVEVYALAADGKTICQVFLLPALGDDPVRALLQQEGEQVPLAEVRLASTPTPTGYELVALIPLSRLHLAPQADEVALELMVAATSAPGGALEYATLFHSVSAFMNARSYGRMKVGK